ncbi:MAG: hypothetical protein ACQCXQ_08245 [Verrucomicrobiales bacterium]|nr:hypothetical protein [Verrucomicrobiota bacterium JB025]
MRSCLGLLGSLFILTLVIGGGAVLFYLSSTSEFSRTDEAPATAETPAKP